MQNHIKTSKYIRIQSSKQRYIQKQANTEVKLNKSDGQIKIQFIRIKTKEKWQRDSNEVENN